MNPVRLVLSGFCLLMLCISVGVAAEPAELPLDWEWVETPFGKPVVDRGPEGAWDHYAVDNPYVYAEDGKYYCFFEAQDIPGSQPDWHERIGLAISEDGLNWLKQDATNPILKEGPAGAWDNPITKLPAGVVKRDGLYYLFFSGRNSEAKQVGVATAKQLTGPWTKSKDNPVLPRRVGKWDQFVTTHPSPVFQRGDEYFLLYRGMKGLFFDEAVGLAVSKDLVHWERASESNTQPVIPVKANVRSLAAAETSAGYVGISQPEKLTERRYWQSNDLVNWEAGRSITIKASVAAETLSAPFQAKGQWIILYEQKDRIYRAVLTPPDGNQE
ncbi:Glycosyl hydrolases family 43 [Polystyrenella longa]|uniref:Glycosyl hydrolases family 43 n=1 Tax=Polystyrenella longa TaxID=2528007 RepID=A0A518CUA9_9PLAN|nr:family 43 glycosylhydrolase [Polystyrenella longa]QDU82795.1 Glycosyl hydrolases family 43 [Polystyrenella longa]